ncbi:MAG: hypothetical protein WBA97_22625 [Actinophytocola sp.]|uniref:hypothetical protein n=1 Tax=Actinophytocola sp. TaxID=1872138 RepID=UPI003C71531C
MTASMTTTSKADCGCGCGGTSAWPATFVRPRFFAGQLLTEDDLSLLVEYTTGKTRLHNRTVYGPGVVCGLEVSCDPCGGGAVTVHPGHALDCRGNDIVLSCKEKVDVSALVREQRVSSLGVDCGEPCDGDHGDGQRRYGLYVRYEEMPADPVAPYATEEPCPTPGCVPSRIREGLRFVVKCDDTEDHRYNPGTRLLASVGPLDKYQPVLAMAQRFELYLDPMVTARAMGTRPIAFDFLDAERYTASLEWLRSSIGGEPPTQDVAVAMTENVRGLASAVARYDTHDAAGQQRIREEFGNLAEIATARQVLGTACELLAGTDQEEVWPDPLRRSIAGAVVAETRARVVPDPPAADALLQVRLLAQGTPVSDALQVEFRNDLVAIREWLLGRIDRAPGAADRTLRDLVRTTPIPRLLPAPEPGGDRQLTNVELGQIEEAAAALTAALVRFVTDAACASLNPPCTDCTDTDVLLAHLELDDCDVLRVCSATREQVLPGGSAYGEWLPKLYPLRELAARLCCRPVAVYRPPTLPDDDPVSRPYVSGLLEEWPLTGDLDQMWNLLLTPAPGETPPKALHEQVYIVPSEVTDSLHELSVLRAQIRDLSATVEALHAQLDTAREQVGQVREQLPDRLGQRLDELESAPPPAKEEQEKEASAKKAESQKPPARRTRSASSRTQKPRPGESS